MLTLSAAAFVFAVETSTGPLLFFEERTIGVGETQTISQNLDPGWYQIVATEMGSDVNLTITAGNMVRTADSPFNGISEELILLGLSERLAIEVQISRLDSGYGTGRYRLEIAPVFSGEWNAVSAVDRALSSIPDPNAAVDRDVWAHQAELFTQAGDRFESLGRPHRAAAAFINAALVARWQLTESARAANWAGRAQRLAASHVQLSIVAAKERGHAARELQRWAEAREAFKAATDIAASAPNRYTQAIGTMAQNDLCLIHRQLAELVEARDCYQPVIDAFDALGYADELANSRHNLAVVLGHLGDYAAAVGLLEEVRAYYEESAHPAALAKTLTALVGLLVRAGDMQSAKSYYTTASGILIERAMWDWLGVLEADYAEVPRLQGDFVLAREHLARAIDYARTGNDLPTAVYAAALLNEIRTGPEANGSSLSALEGLEDLARQSGETAAWHWVRLKVAELALDQGDASTARDRLKAEVPANLRPFWLYLNSRLLILNADYAMALSQGLEGVELAHQSGDRLLELKALTAAMQAIRGNRRDAPSSARFADMIERGTRLSRHLGSSLALPEHRARINQALLDLYEAAVMTAAALSFSAGDEVLWQALTLVDTTRAIALRTYLDAPVNESAEMVHAREQVRRAIWQTLLPSGPVSGVTEPDLGVVLARLESLREFERGQTVRNRSSLFPAQTAERIVTEPDHVIRYFFDGRDFTWAFTIRGKSIQIEKIGTVAEVSELAESVVRHFSRPAPGLGLGAPGLPALSALVLGPAIDDPAVSRVELILDRSLSPVAPSALLRKVGGESRPAIADLRITLSPTLLMRDPGAAAALHWPKTRLAVIADPVTHPQDERLNGTRSDQRGVPRLAAASHEVSRVIRHTKLARHSVHRGFAATPEVLNDSSVLHADIVHIAAHAMTAQLAAPTGVLVLSSYLEDGTPTSGAVLPWDVAALRLKARLTVLGSCRSGQGSYQFGDDLFSLAAAFQYAGSDAVIAAKWDVDDLATANLMDAFYGHLSRGITVGDALRQAQNRLYNDPEFSHPYYWAGFRIHGNPNIAWEK